MKKIIALICTIAIMSTLYIPVGMADTIYTNEGDISIMSVVKSGTCGDNATWELSDDGILTISGTGKMKNYYSSSNLPWYNSRDLIKSVVINEGVTSIGSYAFYGCSGLTSITISEGVTSIEYGTFYGCSGLTSITIPEGVTSIGGSAFDGCSSLTSITIPEGVTSIGSYAFSGCSSLTSITISEGVTSIEGSAFSGCSGLTSITIPEGVTSIGYYAFSGCSGLTSITIPEGVSSIGMYAFYRCSNLERIEISEGVTSIESGTFQECSNLRSITLPRSVTSIGGSAFNGCSSLTSITIPEGVSSIESGTFNGCSSLTSITIPESVTSIGDNAFYYNCSQLATVTIFAENVTFGSSVFGYRRTGLSIIGMEGSSVQTYAKNNNITFIPLKVYTITFNSNGGSEADSISAYNGTAITEPIPTKAESEFQGWYRDTGLSDRFIFTTMPAESITLYAKWNVNSYTITFHTNGGNDIDPITQEYDSQLTKPNNPSKEGYTFAGWYSDEALTQEYTFPTSMPAGDIDLYAKWNVNSYIITFNSNGGSAVAPITQEYGTELTEPIPEKDNMEFQGWYRDTGLTDRFIFTTMPAENITLYAKWDTKKYTITFHTNGGNSIEPIKQEYNSLLTKPNAPTREGYIFNGWYSDEELTREYVFPNRMPAEYIDLYAKWTIITFNITYYANSGEGAPAPAKKEYGITKKISYSIPSRYGYKFMGWATSEGSTDVVYKPGDDYTENKDIELYAVWEYGGKVSDGVEWYFDESDATIHIVGEGEIPDYVADNNVINAKPAPWNILAGQAKHIVIHSGITKMGNYLAGDELVRDDNGLESIKIPDSLKTFSVNWLPEIPEFRKPLDIICSYGHPISISAEYEKQNVIYIDDDTTYPAIPSDFPKIPRPNEKLYRVFDSDNTSLLRLSSYTKGATIFYALDGTDPIQDGEQFVSGSSIKIVPGMTLNTASVLEGYNTAYGEYTFYKATAPSALTLQSTTGVSATLTVNMPEGVSNIIVEYYSDSGDPWEDAYYVTAGANGTIIVNGLKPLTQYMFRLTCEYNGGGKLISNSVIGRTSEYLLPECQVIGVNQPFPFGSTINEATKTITGPNFENAFSSVPVDVDVSLGAEWELYSDKDCTIPIEDNILDLDNEGDYNYGYIKVTAEDGLHVAVYTLKIYRQSKSSPPKFSIPGGNRVPIGTKLTLSAEGDIKYTTDNSNPDENNGIKYNGPITITGETVIKAAAKESDKDEYSDIVAARYTIGDETEFITAYYSDDKVTANLTNAVGSGTIIVALYDTDNRCLSVQSEKVGVIKKMKFAFKERGSYAKIFWWDNLNSMQPQMTTPIYVEYTE